MSIFSAGIIATTIGSIYAGLCLYINGLVADMKAKLSFSVFKGPQHEVNQSIDWSLYVQEIDFHVEIIGYAYAI